MFKIILIGTWYLKKQKQKNSTTIDKSNKECKSTEITTLETGNYIHTCMLINQSEAFTILKQIKSFIGVLVIRY